MLQSDEISLCVSIKLRLRMSSSHLPGHSLHEAGIALRNDDRDRSDTSMARGLILLLLQAALVACATAQFAGTQQLPRHPLVEIELEQWQRVGKPSSGAEAMEVTFAIKQTNLDALERKLKMASTPGSSEYGNYLTFKEMAKIAYGRPESVGAVLRALATVGIDLEEVEFTPAKEYATVKMPVSAIEQLFAAEMLVYEREGKRIGRSKKFTLPKSLIGHVDFVSGVDSFPPRNLVFSTREQNFQPNDSDPTMVNPDVIYKDYSIGNYSTSNPATTQAIGSFLFQFFNSTDLNLFQEKFKVPLNPIAKVVGFDDPVFPGVEADLDVEYITSIGRNSTTWVEYVVDGFIDSWTKLVLNLSDSAPLVHSLSYGNRELFYPHSYLERTNADLMKIAMSGRSVLVASGDSGVDCYQGKYLPVFPTSSPYVTSVGGTNRTKNGTMSTWELGGGGFSNYFPTADFQKEVVEKYLQGGTAPDSKYFNQSGRAYPDVSAYANNCQLVIGGLPDVVLGTSCATPIVAGVVSLLNDVLLNNNKPPLGFLNPILYTAQGEGMIDITTGNNSGYLAPNCGGGFRAIPGWDPATGWGSPNFATLKELLQHF